MCVLIRLSDSVSRPGTQPLDHIEKVTHQSMMTSHGLTKLVGLILN